MIQENSFTAVFFYKGESSNNYWRVNPVFLHINLGENFPGCQTNLMLHEVWRPSEEGFDMEDYAHKALGPILTWLALSLLLLNCKDTSVGTIRPAPKLQKKRKRKKKYPLFDYHVLKLHVHRIRYKGNDPQNLWKNPLHFCRAQKKYYPPESPLFGKIIGEYKWRSQLRGDPRLGIKMKSYEIIPEEKLWKQ